MTRAAKADTFGQQKTLPPGIGKFSILFGKKSLYDFYKKHWDNQERRAKGM